MDNEPEPNHSQQCTCHGECHCHNNRHEYIEVDVNQFINSLNDWD
jgi:hypothetical protein